MSAELVPYSFQTERLPIAPSVPSTRPGWHGVYMQVVPENLDWIVEKLSAWFDGREEVILVDAGECAKSEYGYILLEWEDCQIDPLFLAILREEDFIVDYSVHFRSAEDY